MDTIRLTTAQAIVKWLVAQRTVVDGKAVPMFPGLFGIFGHGNVTCLAEALETVQDELPTWRGHNEQSMAISAIAYAKAMNRRQIMIATSSIGPGCTNMVTAAALAHANRLPLLLLAGDTFQHRVVDPVLQQIERFDDATVTVCDTFKPVTRYWDRITRPQQIVRALPQALATMLDPADCGPAFIGLPQDIQAEAYDYPVAFFETRVHHIRRPGADEREIAAAAAAIAGGKRPLIIAGGGVQYSGAVERLTDFAARRGIPVSETVAGKGTLTADHPNYVGGIGTSGIPPANNLAEEADVIIAIGTRLQDFTTASWTLFKDPNATFVSINAARWDASKHFATTVVADADSAIASLDEALGDYSVDPAWLAGGQQDVQSWNEYLDGIAASPQDGRITYQQVVQAFHKTAQPDDYVLSAAGALPGELIAGWRCLAPGTFDSEYGFSTMGYEVSGGLGAKMARPDGEVIVFVGDGSYLMANSDVYATVFTGHKVIFAICDNLGFAVINRLQLNTGNAEFNNLLSTARHTPDDQGDFPKVDFVMHAQSMGAAAERVTDLTDLDGAIERARASATTYAIVIDVAQYDWIEGGSYWEVGIPEVSEREQVLVARAESDAGLKHQRMIHGS